MSIQKAINGNADAFGSASSQSSALSLEHRMAASMSTPRDGTPRYVSTPRTPPSSTGRLLTPKPMLLATPRMGNKALPPIAFHSPEMTAGTDVAADNDEGERDSSAGFAKIQKFREFVDDELLQLKQHLIAEFDTQIYDWREIMMNVARNPRHERARVSSYLAKVIHVPSLPNSYDQEPEDSDLCESWIGGKSQSTAGSQSTVRQIALDESLPLPVARWRKVFLGLMRPSMRATRTHKYYVNECWVQYLGMLRNNKRNACKAFDTAKENIVNKQRRNTQLMLGNASIVSILSGFAMGSVIHPHTYLRYIWVWFSLFVLLCDSIAVPVASFIDGGHSTFFDALLWATLGFWLIDILVTFRTGIEIEGSVEMDVAKIAKMYAKTWLLFDASLVTIDLAISITCAVLDHNVIIFADKNFGILHLNRLLRLAKLNTIFEEVISMSIKRVIRYSILLKFLLLCTIYFHISACVWYGIGQVDGDVGWVNGCLAQSSQTYCYFTAAHWAFAQFSGTADAAHNTSLELVVATVSSYIGVIAFATLLAMVIETMGRKRNSTGLDAIEMRIRCAAYTQNHSLSKGLSRRLLRYIISCDVHQEDLSQRLRQESEMLQNLPLALQTEILQEARLPHLATIPIIRNLEHVSPVMATRLCSEMVSSVISLGGDFVFTSGDTGTHWRVVETGSLIYACKTFEYQPYYRHDVAGKAAFRFQALSTQDFAGARQKSMSWDSFLTYSSTRKANTLQKGTSISEMVLWTSWVHMGDLIASTDSVLLQLSLDAFSHLLKGRTDACLLAATYAHSYVKQMNLIDGSVSDLYTYSGTGDDLEPELLGIVGNSNGESEGHYKVFLSHYKAEAGTEAALMQESLSKLFAKEMAIDSENPFKEQEKPNVFLDSEDLTDLGALKDMVCRSDNLVLLLTPGVLLRPWVLVEVVTAMANGICIVPVEIQRPGLKFKYPDNEFYAKLHRPRLVGGLLLDEDVKVLENEGITVDDAADCILFVCTQIALPFSPHKSRNIREAELANIVKRCMPAYTTVLGGISINVVSATTIFRA